MTRAAASCAPPDQVSTTGGIALALARAVDLIGQSVGNYRVVRKLGAGGMGTVYVCEHPLIGHRMAMKVLHDEHAFQEARAAASIGHENIIEVIDFGTLTGEQGPVVYLMMELLQGRSLTAHKREFGLSWSEILRVLAQCCRALQASHDHGIVHRDLKPENIYICPCESEPLYVKIMDFGIAKLLAPDASSARTRLGVALGTPAYMSPEQCAGRGGIDARSDIYSLGVVLYELITGQVPFTGELGHVLRGHMFETPVPPRDLAPGVPPALEALCLRALQKDKDARFQTMTAMLEAVTAAQQELAAEDGLPHRDAGAAHPWRRRTQGGAVVLGTAVAVVVVLLWSRPPEPRELLRTDAPAVESAIPVPPPPPDAGVADAMAAAAPPAEAPAIDAAPTPTRPKRVPPRRRQRPRDLLDL
jgi:serine/threonine-protein kinase